MKAFAHEDGRRRRLKPNKRKRIRAKSCDSRFLHPLFASVLQKSLFAPPAFLRWRWPSPARGFAVVGEVARYENARSHLSSARAAF